MYKQLHMTQRWLASLFGVTLAVIITLTGCADSANNTAETESSPDTGLAGPIAETTEDIAPDTAPVTPSPAPYAAPAEPEPSPPPTVAPAAAAPLAGLLLRYGDTLWLVGDDGQPAPLATLPGGVQEVALSPDRQRVLFSLVGEDEIKLADMAAGSMEQLTDTPEWLERGFQWWPARPNVIIFNYMPQELLGPWAGYLAGIDLESGEYRILENEVGSNSSPALAPDGATIAYEKGGEPWLYTWDGDAQPLPVSLPEWSNVRFTSPAWSPEGSELAWIINGYLADGTQQIATAVYSMITGEIQVLHPYTPLGGGGWAPQVGWSPDGNWLNLTYFAEFAGARVSHWIVSRDGAVEHHLGNGENAIWQPQGQALVFARILPGSNETELTLIDPATGRMEPVDPPLDEPFGLHMLVGWIE